MCKLKRSSVPRHLLVLVIIIALFSPLNLFSQDSLKTDSTTIIQSDSTYSSKVDTTIISNKVDQKEKEGDLIKWIKDNWWLVSIIIAPFLPFLFKEPKLYLKNLLFLSYKRYYNNLIKKIIKIDDFEAYPELKLINKLEGTKDLEQFNYLEIFNKTKNFFLQGKPGSGKTSLIRKYIVSQLRDEFLSLPFYKRRKFKLPVFIKYNGEDLFDLIFHNLSSNRLFKNPEDFSINWLRRQLAEGRFFIIIDDVHNLSINTREGYDSFFRLLDYSENRFILVSRDYYSKGRFGFPTYEVLDLSKDWNTAEKIIELISPDNQGSISFVFNHGYSDKLKVYNTPQLLRFFVEVYNPTLIFRQSKYQLFEKFFEHRHTKSDSKRDLKFPFLLLQEVLKELAYTNYSLNDGAYTIEYSKFRTSLTIALQNINTKYSFHNYDIQRIEQYLFEEGYLVKIDSTVLFEHDQWQEFFAAKKIESEKLPVAPLINLNSFKEVIKFICGSYIGSDFFKNKSYWSQFWEDLIDNDFFFASQCSELTITQTIGEYRSIVPKKTFADIDYIKSYTSFLDIYERVILKFFPSLFTEFHPKGAPEKGLLIVIKKDESVSLAFRAIKSGEPRVILEKDAQIQSKHGLNEKGVAFSYYHAKYNVSSLHGYMDSSACEMPPSFIAEDTIKKQLEHIITKGRLFESIPMKIEAVTRQAFSIIDQLKTGTRYRKTFTGMLEVGEILNLIHYFKEKGIYKFDCSDYFSDSHLQNETFSLLQFERDFLFVVNHLALSDDDFLRAPFQDLSEFALENLKGKYTFNDQEQRNQFLDLYSSFIEEMFLSYKEVIETNFSGIKGAFKTYRSYPIKSYIISDDNKEGFLGTYSVFFNTESHIKDVDVSIIDKSELKEIEEEHRGKAGFHSYSGIRMFRHFMPLRQLVYEMVYKEFKDMTK